MSQPPEALWASTGEHPTGSVGQLAVKICKDSLGNTWSVHHPATPEDEAVFATWPGFGVRAIAHALLVEALRRESYMCFLTAMTKNPNLAVQYVAGDEVVKSVIEQALASACNESLMATIPQMAPDAVREILAMMVSQATPKES